MSAYRPPLPAMGIATHRPQYTPREFERPTPMTPVVRPPRTATPHRAAALCRAANYGVRCCIMSR